MGKAGEWAFAVDESSGGYGGYEEDAARELSASTEVVLLTYSEIANFYYYVNGT